jgi:hypothetical protein
MRPTAERRCWAGLAVARQAGPLRNRVRPDTAQPAVSAHPGKTGEEKSPPPPDAGGSPAKFGRPAIIGRWGNGLRVAPGDGGSDLRQKATGGSPRVALHDSVLGRGRVIGGRPEKGSTLALKWTLRSLGLGRCSGWSRCGRRRTGGGGRRWPRHGGDGELERWGEKLTVSVGRGVNNFLPPDPW